jgi:hypothetical protein
VAALVFEHPHKQAPQIVYQQQHARRTLAHRRLLRTEPGETPLVLEFVENVLGIRPLAVKLDDLEGIGFFGRQVGAELFQRKALPGRAVARIAK